MVKRVFLDTLNIPDAKNNTVNLKRDRDMAFDDESLKSWKRLRRQSIGWNELMHDSVGQRIAYGAQNDLPLEIVYSGLKSGVNRRTIHPIEAVRISGLIYIKAYCTLRQEKRTFRLDRIVGARVLGGPPSYSTEIPHKSLLPSQAQINYNYDSNNSFRVIKDFSRESPDKTKNPSFISNPIFWIALVVVMIVFYNTIFNKGNGTHPVKPAAPQMPSMVTPYPKSSTEYITIIPKSAEKSPTEKIPLQPPSIAYPKEKAIGPKEGSEAEPHGASKTYFTIGSSKKNVLEVQGQPSSYHENWWVYGFSTVNFSKDGKVSSYSNIGNNLKVKVIAYFNQIG
jgi:hypothetical protein